MGVTPRAQQRAAWQSRFRGERAAPGRIHLRIDELEFRGASRPSARRMAASFETDLAGLIARDGVPPHWLSHRGADELRAPSGSTSIAQAVVDAGKGPAR